MSNHNSNVLVLTFWSYKDALIQTYTLPHLLIMQKYLPEKSKFFLLTLEKKQLEMSATERQQTEEYLQNNGITLISYPYQNFGFQAILTWIQIIFRLFFLIFAKKIQMIHCFCTPAGVAGYLLSVFTFTNLLIDSYEPHAEACVENKDWKRESLKFKFLFFMEKLMSKRAKYIVSATEGMRNYAKIKYNAEFENFFVKPACVNLELFSEKNLRKTELMNKFGFENKIVCVYAGKFGGIYLDTEIFDFFKVAHNYWQDRFRILILTNHKAEEIENFAKKSNLDLKIIQTCFVFHSQIPDYMGLADFAVTPVKPIPTKRFCTPIKNGEYWALGLPVVSTANISDDAQIIENQGIGSIIHEFSEQEYLRVVKQIDQFLQENSPKKRYQKIRKIAEQYRSFDIAKQIYQKIYGK
ncbi:MAG: hypothetical protein EAZ97_11230 [Bacteroidetes bacterium]|nr:MAG: hypothetical protein EAZ97_11230 [Bacteroidota bacterium]